MVFGFNFLFNCLGLLDLLEMEKTKLKNNLDIKMTKAWKIF